MASGCSEFEHRSRANAIIRRSLAYAGVSIVAVGAAIVFTASPAEAADIDYDEATSAEIEDHLDELETERDETADQLETLQRRLADAQAVVEEAAASYGTTEAQLELALTAVDAAEEDLGAKVTSLVSFAQEQSDRFEEAEAAAEQITGLETDIAETEESIAGLDDQIDEAETAAEEAAEAEAEAAAEAEAQAEAEAEESTSSSSDSSSPTYSSDAATAAVEFARDQLGEPYVYGSAGPDTWDCSGLVMGAYAVSGISLPHNTNAIWAETSSIGRDDLRAGDLVFYNGLGHMAMYIGGGEVIHAPSSGDVVKISGIDMMGIDGYRRV